MMMNPLYFIIMLLMTLMLNSCAHTVSFRPKPFSKSAYHCLASSQDWHIQGKLAIQIPGMKSSSTLMDWQQKSDQYTLLLMNSLGGGSVKVIRQANETLIYTPDGKLHHYAALTPEQLLSQWTKILFPSRAFNYWICGSPIPSLRYQIRTKTKRWITHFTQQGFHVYYNHYQLIQGIDLPSQITIVYPKQLLVKIIIYKRVLLLTPKATLSKIASSSKKE